jgi:D-serine/D-alanine/glycine transporter
MFVWSLILCAYMAYRRKRPQLHQASKYKMPGGVVMCWVCLAFFAFVIVLLTLQTDTREALLASPVWFLLLGAAYVWKRRRAARAS